MVACASSDGYGARSVHRYKADEAYLLAPHKGPVAAYLSVEDIVKLAVQHDVRNLAISQQ
jgi:pyruvate carboxylase